MSQLAGRDNQGTVEEAWKSIYSARGSGSMPGMQVYVCSRTLRQEDYATVTIAAEPEAVVAEVRSTPGKDVWLFGGGSLFRSLAESRLVDTVEVAVIPVLLGEGVPLLPAPANPVTLKFTGHKLYSKTGIMSRKVRLASRSVMQTGCARPCCPLLSAQEDGMAMPEEWKPMAKRVY